MKEDLKKSRGLRIRALRKEAGLTLQALAEKLGITYQSIREWEIGKTSPSGDHIEVLSKILGVSPSWIWTGQGTKYLEVTSEEERPPQDLRANRYKEEIRKLIAILESENNTAIASIRSQLDILYKISEKEKCPTTTVGQKKGA